MADNLRKSGALNAPSFLAGKGGPSQGAQGPPQPPSNLSKPPAAVTGAEDTIWKISKVSNDFIVVKSQSGRDENVQIGQVMWGGRPANARDLKIGMEVKRNQDQWNVQAPLPGPPPQQKFGLPPQMQPAGKAGPLPQGQGNPLMKAGLPVQGPGNPLAKAGLPVQGPGNPLAKAGLPVQGPGNPLAKAGLPAQGPGNPLAKAGLPAQVKPMPNPAPVGKPGPGMNLSGGAAGVVFRIEAQTVKINVGGKMRDIEKVCFANPGEIVQGASVKEIGGGRWTVTAVAKPGAPAQPPPQPRPMAGSLPINTEVSIRNLTSEKVTVVSAAPALTLEILVSQIVTVQGQSVTASQLQPSMKLRKIGEAMFQLLSAPLEKQMPLQPIPKVFVQVNYISASSLDVVFPDQMSISMNETREFVANKYSAIYWSRGNSDSRSVSTYLFQCMLFEKVLRQQHKPTPISDALQMAYYLDNYPPTVPCIRHPDFEKQFQQEVDFIDGQITGLFTKEENVDFAGIADRLKVAIVVLKQTRTGQFEKLKVFPSGQWDLEWQKLTIVGKPPYPVLITKKLASLLDKTMEIHAVLPPFIFTKQKLEPPHIDRALVEQMAKLSTFDKDLRGMTTGVLALVQKLLARVYEMQCQQQLTPEFCSTEVGMQLSFLWETLQKLQAYEFRDNPSLKEAKDLLEQLINCVWEQFGKKCDYCGAQFRDIMFDCKSHGLCQECFAKQINEVRMKGSIVSPTEDTTSLYCPIAGCNVYLSKKSLQANNKEIFSRLLCEVDQIAGLKECEQCGQRRPQAIVWQLQCLHTCCVMCANEQNTYCKKCSKDMTQVPASMSQWPLECQACRNSFTANLLIPALCGAFHIVCPSCAFIGCRNKCCSVQQCGKSYLQADLNVLRARVMGMCQACQKSRPYSEFLDLACADQICLSCGVIYVKEYGGTFTNCWICQTPFSQETANLLYEKSGMSKEVGCMWCGGLRCDIQLVCGDKVHSQCLKTLAYQQSMQEPMKRIDCACGIEVYTDMVFQLVSRAELPQLAAANPESYEVKCPNCHNQTFSVPATLDSMLPTQCECGAIFCAFCSEIWGQDHDQNHCKMLMSKDLLLKMESKKKQGLQCPYCKMANEKSIFQPTQFCEHCKYKDAFCSECGARMDAVEKHGASYHRPDCSYHGQELFGAGYQEGCSMCADFGDSGCQPPPRQARRGRLPPGSSY